MLPKRLKFLRLMLAFDPQPLKLNKNIKSYLRYSINRSSVAWQDINHDRNVIHEQGPPTEPHVGDYDVKTR